MALPDTTVGHWDDSRAHNCTSSNGATRDKSRGYTSTNRERAFCNCFSQRAEAASYTLFVKETLIFTRPNLCQLFFGSFSFARNQITRKPFIGLRLGCRSTKVAQHSAATRYEPRGNRRNNSRVIFNNLSQTLTDNWYPTLDSAAHS